MSQYLTPELFESLKDKTTPGGVSLLRNIRSGVDVPSAEVGLTAGDAESYDTFKELFDPVIGAYHGVDTSGDADLHSSNQDSSELDRMENIAYDYVVSSHIRCVRNVKGQPLAPSISEAQRNALAQTLKECLKDMKGEFAGEYFDLSKMPAEERTRLESAGLMMAAPPAGTEIESSGVGNDWPLGRGVFSNGSNEFAIFVNGNDHVILVCQNQGGDIGAVFEDWIGANNGLENCLASRQMSFQKSSRLGHLSSSPAHIGTGLRAGMVLRLANLGQNEDELRSMCKELGVRVKRHPSLENCWDVTNQATLGKTEVEIVQLIIDAVATLTEREALSSD
jgi:creatine kinase